MHLEDNWYIAEFSDRNLVLFEDVLIRFIYTKNSTKSFKLATLCHFYVSKIGCILELLQDFITYKVSHFEFKFGGTSG